MEAVINDAKRYGSMKDSALAHGITNIDYLFPDAQNVTKTPTFIQRDMGWVQKVMNSIHPTPFSRIKSTFADITEEDARAKGYIKGSLKKEEVFSLLKRTTTPTTIYKKQKMDRDDVVDITDFDVVAWLKAEMRIMLDEEIARALLVGDGRLSSSDDKINESNIRPVWKDADLYTIKTPIEVATNATADDKAKAFIRAAIKARKAYKGSGSPTLYTTDDMLTDCLLLTDSTGRDLYESVEKLATKLRVKEIVTVPVMEGLSRTAGTDTFDLMGIVTNLADYNIGADKGGSVNMFDDFDIDYNAQKYLIETRCSGALVKPYSAIALELKTPNAG
jgi:HK97 family phage major capsid protein